MGEKKNGRNSGSKGNKGTGVVGIVAAPDESTKRNGGDSTAISRNESIESTGGNDGRFHSVIVAPGTVVESNSDGGVASVDAGTVAGNAGTGTGSGSDSGNGSGNRPAAVAPPIRTAGKPGRHPNNCECERCIKRREEKAKGTIGASNLRGLDSPGSPKDNVFPFDAFSSKAALGEQFRKSIGIVWEGIYQMPILMGYGTYWALNPAETNALTEQSVNLLEAVPDKQRKQIMGAISTWLPLSTFMVTAGMITYPRIQMARAEMIARQKGNNVSCSTTTGQPGTSGQTGAGGENPSDYSGSNIVRESAYSGLVKP